MTAAAQRAGYQREVDALLEQIRRRVDELHRLRARGVRGAALADLKRELGRSRRQLAGLVSRAGWQLAPNR